MSSRSRITRGQNGRLLRPSLLRIRQAVGLASSIKSNNSSPDQRKDDEVNAGARSSDIFWPLSEGRCSNRIVDAVARNLYNKYSNDIKWFIQTVEGLLQYLGMRQEDLMKEVQNQTSYMRRREAATEILIDRLIKKEKNKDKALLIIVSDKSETCPDLPLLKKEHVVLNFVNALLQRDARPVFYDENKQYPLHHAVKRGFRKVVSKLLDYDAYPLERDKDNKMPLHLALEKEQDEIATLILKQMPNDEVRKLFLAEVDERVDLDVQADIRSKADPDNEVDLERSADRNADSNRNVDPSRNADPNRNADSNWNTDPDKISAECSFHEDILKKKMTNTALEILTCMVDIDEQSQKVTLDFSLLEADAEGRSRDHSMFEKGSLTAFQLIAKTRNKDVACHFVIKQLIKHKWITFARRRFIVKFLVFLLSIFFMTCAAVSGVVSSDPTHYDLPIDKARAVCEVGALMMVFFKVCPEIYQMGRRKLEYWKEIYNYIDLASLCCILAVVPLRWCHATQQWQVFGVGYLFWTFRVFKYAVVTRRTGAYCQILWQMISRDFPQFTIVFLVILLAFSGSFLLTLKGENSLDVHNETSDFWQILFTGVRILIEGGPVVDYTGPDGYKVLSTILMAVFLFVSIVVLLNILIAQLSDTYEKVQQDAEREFIMNRMWIISRLERNSVFNHCRNSDDQVKLTQTLEESDWSSGMERKEEDYNMQIIENGLESTQLDISFLKSKLSNLDSTLRQMQENQEVIMNHMRELAPSTTT